MTLSRNPGTGKGNIRGLIYESPDETHLERWVADSNPRRYCKECGSRLIERLDEHSILTTTRCKNGHRRYDLQ